jgi:hypothetical protein
MPWRVMTTISAFGPAGSGIGAARGLAEAASVLRADGASSFNGQIQQAIRRAGGNPSRLGDAGKGGGRFNQRGRGASVAAVLKNRKPWSRDGGIRTRSRRVAVKARVVKLNPQRGAARDGSSSAPKPSMPICAISSATV